ncbi:hypothetical protein ACET3X_000913 [Alternaria dauci]|uniref:Uncharacterized protein n=1 Tax=Alternaria dauci TaxID=48095 RepID=A0ABR3UYT7_9PLEO
MDALRSVAGWDSIKSKRLRFMRYWVQKTMGYPELLRASDLGIELKRLRVQWKQEQHRQLHSHSRKRTQKTSNPTSGPRSSNAIEGVQRPPVGRSAASSASLQRSEQRATPELFDPKLGPNPRPPDVKSQSPLKALGFRLEMPSMRRRTYTIPEDQQDIHPALREQPPSILVRAPTDASEQPKRPSSSVESFQTLRPEDSMSVVNPCPALIPPSLNFNRRPLQTSQSMKNDLSSAAVINPAPSTISRASAKTHAPSAATTHTIASYYGGPSARADYVDPLDNPIYNHIETQEERLEKYRRLLDTHPDSDPFAEYEDDAVTLPTPKRQSIYSAFGDDAFDDGRFDTIDEELAADEIENWEKEEPDEEDEVFDEKKYG